MLKVPVEFPFGIPLYHFRFVAESNHVPKSAVQCDFVSLAIDPKHINWISNDIHDGFFLWLKVRSYGKCLFILSNSKYPMQTNAAVNSYFYLMINYNYKWCNICAYN